MDDRLVSEILAAHADGLNAGQDRSQDYLAMFPVYAEELASLFRLASLAKRVLVPVEPSVSFRHYLGESLVQAARRQIAHPPAPVQPRVNRELVIRAAAAGSALAGAGVLALMWRSWTHRSQPTTTIDSRPAA
jgi:hypothetical protein